MPDTGWLSGASVTQYSSGSSQAQSAGATASNMSDGDWTTSAYADDSKGANVTLQPLLAHNFGLGGLIPSGSLIDGVEVRFYTSDIQIPSSVYFELIEPTERNPAAIAQASSTTWTANSSASAPYETSYDGSETIGLYTGQTIYVGAADALWGYAELAQTELANSGFGVLVGAAFYSTDGISIYEVQMKVHYTEVASDPMSVRDGGTWKPASPHVKDGGIWKPATPHVKDGGIWKAS